MTRSTYDVISDVPMSTLSEAAKIYERLVVVGRAPDLVLCRFYDSGCGTEIEIEAVRWLDDAHRRGEMGRARPMHGDLGLSPRPDLDDRHPKFQVTQWEEFTADLDDDPRGCPSGDAAQAFSMEQIEQEVAQRERALTEQATA
mgnify:CR=1 FL=1